MDIVGFGDTYAGAYIFATYNVTDGVTISRPPVVTDVDGSAGTFDHFGTDNYPIASLPIQKTHTLIGSSYADIDTKLDALKAATWCLGRSKLWGVLRDGTTKRWTWAKCTALKYSEIYGKQFVDMQVDLQFAMQDAVWYGETQHNRNAPGSPWTATNSGNAPTPVRIDFQAYSSPPVSYTVTAGNSTNGTGFSYTHAIAGNKHLIIDASTMTCTNDSADSYAYLTPTSRSRWLELEAGDNTMTYTFNDLAAQYRFYWYDAYM